MLAPEIFEWGNKLVFNFVFHYEGYAVVTEFVCSKECMEELTIRYDGPGEITAVRLEAVKQAERIKMDHFTIKTTENERN